MSSNFFGKTTLFCILSLIFLTVACVPATSDPPPTIQAVFEDTQLLTETSLDQVEVLQDQAYGSGRILLYSWQAEGGTCLASSYLTSLNGSWTISDTLSLPCQPETEFMAGYTNVSTIETNLGSPRQTVAYGTSTMGNVVRVIWADGLVEQVPLDHGSFLTVRSGRWTIERIDLIDASGSLIQTEDWTLTPVQATG